MGALVFVLLVCMGNIVCVVVVADLMLCAVWFIVLVLVRYANSDDGPKLFEGFVRSFEVEVERGDGSCADGELYNRL